MWLPGFSWMRHTGAQAAFRQAAAYQDEERRRAWERIGELARDSGLDPRNTIPTAYGRRPQAGPAVFP